MDVKDYVTKLTDDELAQQLKSLKQDVGPITPSTRPLYEKRLLRCVLLEQASSCTITYSQQCNNESSSSTKSVTVETNRAEEYQSGKAYELSKDLINCSIFYGVQLPAEVHNANGMYVQIN